MGRKKIRFRHPPLGQVWFCRSVPFWPVAALAGLLAVMAGALLASLDSSASGSEWSVQLPARLGPTNLAER
jgi:hypothetical protein